MDIQLNETPTIGVAHTQINKNTSLIYLGALVTGLLGVWALVSKTEKKYERKKEVKNKEIYEELKRQDFNEMPLATKRLLEKYEKTYRDALNYLKLPRESLSHQKGVELMIQARKIYSNALKNKYRFYFTEIKNKLEKGEK